MLALNWFPINLLFMAGKIGNKMGDATAQSMLKHMVSANASAETEKKEIYRIGDLAREFDVSLRTLRFYEDRGLISPKRSGSTRLYSNEDRDRLQLILLAKNVGFSLVDIQAILKIYDDDTDKDHTDDDLQFLVDKFREQHDRLKRQRSELDVSISELSRAIACIDDKS